MDQRIQNIERQLQHLQDQLTRQNETLQAIFNLLSPSSNVTPTNNNNNNDLQNSSNNRIVTPIILPSSSPSSPLLSPSTTLITETLPSPRMGRPPLPSSSTLSSPSPPSPRIFPSPTVPVPSPTTSIVRPIPAQVTAETTHSRKMAVHIRQKRKRAIERTKELCKSLPYFIKPKPVDDENESTNGRKRCRQSSPICLDTAATTAATATIQGSPDCPPPPPSTSRNTSISPVIEIQKESPESLLDHETENSISLQITECSSYLALYNYLNSLNTLSDQHTAVLKIIQLISGSSGTRAKWYLTFLDSQGGVILLVRWLRDVSQHVQLLSPDAIIFKLIEANYNFVNSTYTHMNQEIMQYDCRLYMQSMILLFDKIHWTKDMTFTTRIDKVIKSLYKYFTTLGNLLTTHAMELYRQLGREFLAFSQNLKVPWSRYRQILSD